MNIDLLLENLRNPALLFFALGLVAVLFRSDLEIPSGTTRFISLYLLFAIGFRGGQELSHESFDGGLLRVVFFGVFTAISIPLYSFPLLKTRLNIFDSGAVAAVYGSVSAVTFITGAAWLEAHGSSLNGHMVAVMAIMEAPAIIVGLLLVSLYDNSGNEVGFSKVKVFRHSFTNGSVFMILGSLTIGLLADSKQAKGIEPFTNDLFQGFLAIFLLDLGIMSGRKLKAFFSYGFFPLLFAFLMPLFNGVLFAFLSRWVTSDVSDRFMLAVLAASASYIAVPATMKVSLPRADPGLFLPMALAVTFPVNVTLGLPLYFLVSTKL